MTQRRVQTNFTGGSGFRLSDRPGSVDPEQQEPVALVPADPNAVPQGTAREVLGWVGTDADRAGRALDAEQTSSDPRKVLVTALTKLSGRKSTAPQEQPQPPAAPQVTPPSISEVPR